MRHAAAATHRACRSSTRVAGNVAVVLERIAAVDEWAYEARTQGEAALSEGGTSAGFDREHLKLRLQRGLDRLICQNLALAMSSPHRPSELSQKRTNQRRSLAKSAGSQPRIASNRPAPCRLLNGADRLSSCSSANLFRNLRSSSVICAS